MFQAEKCSVIFDDDDSSCYTIVPCSNTNVEKLPIRCVRAANYEAISDIMNLVKEKLKEHLRNDKSCHVADRKYWKAHNTISNLLPTIGHTAGINYDERTAALSIYFLKLRNEVDKETFRPINITKEKMSELLAAAST